MSKEIILTGLRPNDEYHLGNYIGALLPIINLINDKSTDVSCDIHLFIPDLHSFTTPIDFSNLNAQIEHNLRLMVACGVPLDQDNIHLYRQSHIPAHAELTWILSNFAGFGELSRMVEFKEKSQRLKNDDRISVGLFTYPILMAADILLYDARWVPVGDDQRQHLEFCRNIAISFNQQFKTDIFTIPADYGRQQAFFKRLQAPRIRNLRDPQKKMSKSINDVNGTIMLSDSPQAVESKIMSATTDSLSSINYDWQTQAGITNLLTILACLKHQPQAEINKQYLGQTNYRQLKIDAIEIVNQTLADIEAVLKQVSSDDIFSHLQNREEHLNKIGNAKIQSVHKILGLKK